MQKMGEGNDMVWRLRTRVLYDRGSKPGAATQHLTIVYPSLHLWLRKNELRLIAGYLLMFVMSFIGIVITLVFVRLESRGFIQKRGAEEAQAS